MRELLLKAKEVSEETGLSIRQVQRLVNKYKLQKIGDKALWKADLLADLVPKEKAVSHKECFEEYLHCLEQGWLTKKPPSPVTVGNYKGAMTRFFKLFENVNYDTVRLVIEQHPPHKHGSRKNVYNGARSFVKYLVKKGLMSTEEEMLIKSLQVPNVPAQPPTSLKAEQVDTILDWTETYSFKNDYHKRLTKTIFLIMFYTGIRRGELIRLKVQDLNFEIGVITVKGKGSKTRVVPLHPDLATYLKEEWFPHRKPGELLLSCEYGRMVSERRVNYRMERIQERTGIKIHPHKLRKTYATTLSQNGVPVEIISKSLGHTSIAVTEKHYFTTTQFEAAERIREVKFR